MKKCLLFLIILLGCCGCSAEYHLDIDSIDKMNEEVVLSASSSDDYDKIRDYSNYLPINYNSDEPAVFEKKLDDIEYYRKKKSNDNSHLSFSYSYNMEKMKNNMITHSCFEYVNVMTSSLGQDKDAELMLSTSDKFLCFEHYDNLDKVHVVITSKYKLKETNADNVSKHQYEWTFRRNDSDGKYIYLLLDARRRDLTLWERFLEGEFVNVFTISILLFMIGGLVFFLLKKKGDRRDKI